MAGLIKEMLFDYVDRLDIESKADISIAIQKSIKSQLFDQHDLRFLDLYIQGYSVLEISDLMQTDMQYIIVRLILFLKSIETLSDYTDVKFIKRVEQNSQNHSKVHKLANLLTKHGQQFATHTIEII